MPTCILTSRILVASVLIPLSYASARHLIQPTVSHHCKGWTCQPRQPLACNTPSLLRTLRGGNTRNMTTTSFELKQQDMSNDDDPWIPIGGGVINEKTRRYDTPSSQFDPKSVKAHLWHALEGLDRYPNYLSRWNDEDMDRLEQALQHQLSTVQTQRGLVQQRRREMAKLTQEVVQANPVFEDMIRPPKDWHYLQNDVLHPKLVQAIFGSKQFRDNPPPLPSVLRGDTKIELDASCLTQSLEEELCDVYSLPLLQLTYCQRLRAYVSVVTDFAKERPEYANLNVGRHPLDMSAMGLEWLMDLLFQLVLRSIGQHLFESTESKGDLDFCHGFISGYSASPTIGKPRDRLVTHSDDAEVTLNLCLGDTFEGGAIQFQGLRGTDQKGQTVEAIVPQPGMALIHAGRHFHTVTPVTSGDRFVLILWARSWQGIRSSTCPCCWLNRRQDASCICGSRWN